MSDYTMRAPTRGPGWRGPGRILCPDDHPDRYGPDSSEAFASVARALRDEVLPDPAIKTVFVMVGAPGSGKSTAARRIAAKDRRTEICSRAPLPVVVVLDACHSKPGPRRALVQRIKAAGKEAICVRMDTPLRVCKFRQLSRENPVPNDAVVLAHYNINKHPPTMSEGWKSIEYADGGVCQTTLGGYEAWPLPKGGPDPGLGNKGAA